jgi:hypothetical protein
MKTKDKLLCSQDPDNSYIASCLSSFTIISHSNLLLYHLLNSHCVDMAAVLGCSLLNMCSTYSICVDISVVA